MIQVRQAGNPGANTTTLVLMHFLGGSTREWDEVIANLGPQASTLAVDLPGFGDNASVPGYSIAEMADAVEEALGRLGGASFVLVGHSMSGTVAAVLARRFEDAADAAGKASGLRGMVLVSPSPPGPEPMEESKRQQMLSNLGERHEDDLQRARRYITKNEQRDVPEAALERSAQEVLRMDRAAWRAWLESGSKEDWTERIGSLRTPTLIVAGEKDAALGAEVQRTLTLPSFAHGELRVLAGTGHLAPLERPVEMAEVLKGFVTRLDARSPEAAAVPRSYREFLESDRLSEPTRAVLETRLEGPKPNTALSGEQLRTLRAMLEHIIPQQLTPEGRTPIDLAGYVAATLSSGKGDGWRFAQLPGDAEAFRMYLDRFAAAGFTTMTATEQDAALHDLGRDPKSTDARWFEDLRAAAVDAWMAHPATLARLGYSGVGVGGALTPHKGYVNLAYNSREAWEPVPVPVAAAAGESK